VVIPKAGEHISEEEMREYCKGQISYQKIPRYFQFVEFYSMTASEIGVLITATFISVVWRFNVWRSRTPKSLYDLVEKKRIDVPDGDINTLYLGFLENYRDAMASPKRYFLCSFLMILFSQLVATQQSIVTT